MRYYLLCAGDELHTPAHVLAEVVHDVDESIQDRDVSLGSPLVGARSKLVSEHELRQSAAGVAALYAWNAKDDSVFDAETAGLSDAPEDHAPTFRLIQGGAGR